MGIEYVPKFLDGMTVEDIDKELEQQKYELWRYGRSIDRPRMWDLLHTKKVIQTYEAKMKEASEKYGI